MGSRELTYVITGADGQVGWHLARYLDRLGPTVRLTRHDLDMTHTTGIAEVLERQRPDVIFNCAAYTAVDEAGNNSGLALRINGEAVGAIGDFAATRNIPVVHISTDYVFDGNATRPYREDDPAKPVNTYGRSKLEGEKELVDSKAPHLIVRTSWVFSNRRQNFARTMLRLAREREELRVVSDQRGSPTGAKWFAGELGRIAQELASMGGRPADGFRKRGGLLHLTGGGETTWDVFAKAILAADPDKGEHKVQRVLPISSAEYGAVAQRPKYSVLDCSRALNDFRVRQPPWQDLVKEVFEPVPAKG